jgi:hypothetical protein
MENRPEVNPKTTPEAAQVDVIPIVSRWQRIPATAGVIIGRKRPEGVPG